MSSAPHHVTESVSDRKKSRELAEARQSGAIAPAVDSKTGAMINPHNPEFITKRPWYLGGDGMGGAAVADAGMSLDHQADQRLDKDRIELSMASADRALNAEREALKEAQKKNAFKVGMWVEALKNNKLPYRICKVTSATKKWKNVILDLEYEDGSIERKVKIPKPQSKSRSLFSEKPRVRMTKTGARSHKLDASVYGKETFDSKRDKYRGYRTTCSDMSGTGPIP